MFVGGGVQTEVTPIIAEYFQRKSLADIGYRFKADDLSCFKADCFGIIAHQLKVIESREIEKAKSKIKKK